MKNLLLACCFIYLLTACTEPTTKKEAINTTLLNNFTCNTLLGTWVNEEDSVVITESWSKENDTLLIGNAMAIKGADTLFSEKIKIINSDLKAVYIPQITDQNEGKEVVFNLTFSDSAMFRYSNLEHDFPQHIEYKFITKDSLVARVYGTIDGKVKEEVFAYRRK